MARILTDETSLTRKIKSLARESSALQKLLFFETGLAVLLLAAGGVFLLLGKGSGLLIIGGLVSILPVGHWLKVRENTAEDRSAGFGLRGEQEVTKLLKNTLGNDSYILNDIMVRHGWKRAQIDHLVVTPRGIFVLETKNWSGAIEGDEQDKMWTKVKRPGEKPQALRNPILQNRRQIEILRLFLQDKGVDWPDIHPMLVSKSRNGVFTIRNRTVPIYYPADAATHIAAQTCERVYLDEEVTAVINQLMRTL